MIALNLAHQGKDLSVYEQNEPLQQILECLASGGHHHISQADLLNEFEQLSLLTSDRNTELDFLSAYQQPISFKITDKKFPSSEFSGLENPQDTSHLAFGQMTDDFKDEQWALAVNEVQRLPRVRAP
jgi:hypothetical protein